MRIARLSFVAGILLVACVLWILFSLVAFILDPFDRNSLKRRW